MSTRYIQRKDNMTGEIETVDELLINDTADRNEFKRLIVEYNYSDYAGVYYGSQRACKEWADTNERADEILS